MKSKKGQGLGGLYAGVMIIVATALLLVILLYIYATMITALQVPLTAGDVANDTITQARLTAGPARLSVYTYDDAVCAITQVKNSTITVNTGNYSLVVPCQIRNLTSTFADGSWNVTYTYTYSADTSSSTATKTITTQFIAFLPWLGIILLVLAAGVVLFFVIRSFAGGTKGV